MTDLRVLAQVVRNDINMIEYLAVQLDSSEDTAFLRENAALRGELVLAIIAAINSVNPESSASVVIDEITELITDAYVETDILDV